MHLDFSITPSFETPSSNGPHAPQEKNLDILGF
jgi:hypothetical protein